MPLSTRFSAGERRAVPPVLWAGLLLAAALVAAVLTGPFALSPGRILELAAARIAGQETPGAEAAVLFGIRLPRVAAAALAGAALATAGAAYQVTFRNPLVSPDILGVSAGAGLGAVLGIFLGLPVLAIQGLSFGFGLATVALVMAVAAAMGGRGETLTLVLCGMAIGALAGAGIALMKALADPDDQLPAMTFWLLGSLAGIRPGDVLLALPPMLAGLVPLVLLRWRTGLLAMGEDEARALGIETGRLRWMVIASATLITAAAVAAAGTIGWIGLMVPHMARLLAGSRFDRVLPVALLLGAALMVAIDTAARSLAATELPLGVLTAAIGAPVFLVLLARRGRGWS
nr:iron ABC transporter permease [Poseidonocella sp. HB161398]